jgi:multiple sugar transport system ATP-binding protein
MELHKKLGSTMIYVTHDQVEAMTMADKIVVMNAGLIEQIGSPLELYHKPDNKFVASFIGSPKMNFISGKATTSDGTNVTVDLGSLGTITLPRATKRVAGDTVTLGIRPEHLVLGKSDFTLTVTPKIVEHLGIHTVLYADLPGGETFIGLFEGAPDITEGVPLELGFKLSSAHLFDTGGLAVY